MSDHIGYIKQMETKIVRTTHRVTFHEGIQAIDLIAFLQHVPAQAKIIEVSDGYDEDKPTRPYIVFEEEKAEGNVVPQ